MRRLSLLIGLVTLVSLPHLATAQSCMHSASSQGAIDQFVNNARPGNTLCIEDGTYARIHIPTTFAGTQAQPITIRARHDGKVLLNGGSSYPLMIRGKWGILEGVNATGGSNTVVSVSATDWILRRFVAWSNNTTSPNSIVSTGGQRLLFEDCAAFGNARKALQLAQGGAGWTDKDNVVRRCWARFEQCPTCGSGAPTVGLEIGYDESHALAENVIGTWDTTGRYTAPEAPLLMFGCPYCRLFGSIGYAAPGSNFSVGKAVATYDTAGTQGQDHQVNIKVFLKDVVGVVPLSIRGKRGVTLSAGDKGGSGRAENVYSISDLPGTCGGSGMTCVNFRSGTTVAAAIAGTDKATIWEAAPGICKRYVNGTLTNQPLWPWPMNQRIKDALVQSGREPHDVTQTMSQLLGPIPEACRGSAPLPEPGPEPEPKPVPAPTNLRLLQVR